MRWAVAAFAVVTAGLAAGAILTDRQVTLDGVKDRTGSLARMIMAHGEAAISDADQIVSGVEEMVAEWDLEDPAAADAIYTRLRDLTIGAAGVSAAWVVDPQGVSRLDTWVFPGRPVDVAEESYFRLHQGGAADPVMVGGRVAALSGRERFTFSRALRGPEDELRAIIVVGIYAERFDLLYAEAANWPGAGAGLYGFQAGALARLHPEGEVDDWYQALRTVARQAPAGSAVVETAAGKRLVSWRRSMLYPDLFASTSQRLDDALRPWRERSLIMAAVATAAVAGFGLFALTMVRAAEARQAAALREVAIREVHHRVKNALQLVTSMITLRIRRAPNEAARGELEEIRNQIRTVAAVEDLLQNAARLEEIDVAALIERLCAELGRAYRGAIAFASDGGFAADTGRATSIGIIANELVTNAMKHATGRVEVACSAADGGFALTVADDGPGLPPGFEFDASRGFGLVAARMMAEGLGGTLVAVPRDAGGAAFRLELPAEPPD